VYLGFFNKHGWIYCRRKKNSTLCKHRFPCNTLTHLIKKDLLNIKRKGDPEVSYPLSYVRYHWNPEPVCNKSHFVSLFYLYWYFFNLLNLFWHADKNFCFYAEVNFWDFVRNDNSNKGTTARLNETRFGPKKKVVPNISRPKKSRHFLMKLPDNFQMREHSLPCRFHIKYIINVTTTEINTCKKNIWIWSKGGNFFLYVSY
jgi:hypothetical protein